MLLLNIKPGIKVGHLLQTLLEEVLDDPDKNTKEYLENRLIELNKLSDDELEKLSLLARERKEKLEEKEIQEIRQKYWVK